VINGPALSYVSHLFHALPLKYGMNS